MRLRHTPASHFAPPCGDKLALQMWTKSTQLQVFSEVPRASCDAPWPCTLQSCYVCRVCASGFMLSHLVLLRWFAMLLLAYLLLVYVYVGHQCALIMQLPSGFLLLTIV